MRDRLLGGAQGKDIDLVTVGHRPDAAARRGRVRVRLAPTRAVRAVRHRADPRAAHGSSRVFAPGPERYDPESRNPDVRPGTLDEDVWRRDFTVNALCQSLDGRGDRHHRPGGRRPARRGASHAARPPRPLPRTRCGCTGRLDSSPGSASRSRPGPIEAMRAQAGENLDPLGRAGQRRAPPPAGRAITRAPGSRCSARGGCSSSSCPSCIAAIGDRAGRVPHRRRLRAHPRDRRRGAGRPGDPNRRAAARHRQAADPRGRRGRAPHLLRPPADRRRDGAGDPHPLALQQ